ncbi:breast cancer type 2 susceptibility protein [Anaeramoeba flamelloides]|uniref:Breast cancer type 2 susceptibility protein n=1 Tax=Anaeramoeba flamelloides TaxID=1746091 RepID=A0ABQ8XTB7_9EUKA|nr:breast cancer type 2 susceptibility protein [Anaeramoeba flamelloides]
MKVKLILKLNQRETFVAEIEESQTIQDLKKLYFTKTSVAIINQKIFRNKILLENERTIESYKIKDQETLDLTIKSETKEGVEEIKKENFKKVKDERKEKAEEEEGNKTQNPNQFFGISSGHGNTINISKEKLEMARRSMDLNPKNEDEDEKNKETDGEENNKIKEEEDEKEKEKEEEEEEDEKNEKAEEEIKPKPNKFFGFLSGHGNTINISKEKLEMARKSMDLKKGKIEEEDEKIEEEEDIDEEENEDKEDENNEKAEEEKTKTNQNPNQFSGFSSGHGNTIKISKEKLEMARKSMDLNPKTEEKNAEEKDDENNKIQVENDEKNEKKEKAEEEEEIKPKTNKFFGFSSGHGNTINISKDKLEMARRSMDLNDEKIEEDDDDDEENEEEEDEKNEKAEEEIKPKPNKFFGFSSGHGNTIKISKEKLETARKSMDLNPKTEEKDKEEKDDENNKIKAEDDEKNEKKEKAEEEEEIKPKTKQFFGFSSGNGNKIKISKEKLETARKSMDLNPKTEEKDEEEKDDENNDKKEKEDQKNEKEEIKPNPKQFFGFSSGHGNTINISKDKLEMARRSMNTNDEKIEEEDEDEDNKMKVENDKNTKTEEGEEEEIKPNPKKFFGFSSGHGNSIKISKDELEMARRSMNLKEEEIEEEDETDDDKKDEDKEDENNEEKEEKNKTNQNPNQFFGFSSGHGNSINISKEKLEMARKSMDLNKKENDEEDETDDEENEEEEKNEEENEKEKIKPKPNNFSGFSSGHGNSIKISKEKLEMARKSMDLNKEDDDENKEEEEEEEEEENEKEKIKSSPNNFFGFSSGNGNSIKISKDKLEMARRSMNLNDQEENEKNNQEEDIDDENQKEKIKSTPNKFFGFSSGHGNSINISKDKLQMARKSMDLNNNEDNDENNQEEDIDDENKKLETKSTPNKFFGFSSGHGNSINISKEKLQMARKSMNLNKEENDETKEEDIDSKDIKEEIKPKNQGSFGFSSGHGNSIKISKEKLEMARRSMNLNKEENDETKEEYDEIDEEENEKEEIKSTSNKSFGFSSGHGNSIKISKDKLEMARRSMNTNKNLDKEEDDDEEEKMEEEKNEEDDNGKAEEEIKSNTQRTFGFSSGNGNTIKISKEKLEMARRSLNVNSKDDDNNEVEVEEEIQEDKNNIKEKIEEQAEIETDKNISMIKKPKSPILLNTFKQKTSFGKKPICGFSHNFGSISPISKENYTKVRSFLSRNSISTSLFPTNIKLNNNIQKQNPQPNSENKLRKRGSLSTISNPNIKIQRNLKNKHITDKFENEEILEVIPESNSNNDNNLINKNNMNSIKEYKNKGIEEEQKQEEQKQSKMEMEMELELELELEIEMEIENKKEQKQEKKIETETEKKEEIIGEMKRNKNEQEIIEAQQLEEIENNILTFIQKMEQEEKQNISKIEDISIIKEKLEIYPMKYYYYLPKISNKLRPNNFTKQKLDEYNIDSEIQNLNSISAKKFKFSNKFIDLKTIIEICKHKENNFEDIIMNGVGVEEIKRRFLLDPTINKKFASDKWIENHYRWIVWKLACYVRQYPQLLGKCENYFTPLHVLCRLKRRHQIEFTLGKRPAFKKILERDEPSSRQVILCVSSIISYGNNNLLTNGNQKNIIENNENNKENDVNQGIDDNDNNNNNDDDDDENADDDDNDDDIDESNLSEQYPNYAIVELTDGWYSVNAVFDNELTKLVQNKKIFVGLKLRIFGARIQGSSQGASPLEITSSTILTISINGTRRAKWDEKLGLQAKKFFYVNLNSIKDFGGMVPGVKILVQRKYPLLFSETVGEKKMILTEREEIRRSREHELYRIKTVDKICQEIDNKWRKKLQKQNKLRIQETEEDIRNRFIEQEQEKKDQIEEIQETDPLMTRKSSMFFRFKAIDCITFFEKRARFRKPVIITKWNCSLSDYDLFKEGKTYQIMGLKSRFGQADQSSTSSSNGNSMSSNSNSILRLNATSQSTFIKPISEFSEEQINSIFVPRSVYSFNEIPKKKMRNAELDIVGIYLYSVQKQITTNNDQVKNINVIYLSDDTETILKIKIWSENTPISFKSLKPQQTILTILNLKMKNYDNNSKLIECNSSQNTNWRFNSKIKCFSERKKKLEFFLTKQDGINHTANQDSFVNMLEDTTDFFDSQDLSNMKEN